MSNPNQIKHYIAALEHMTKFFKTLLNEENAQHDSPANERERLKEITYLRSIAKSDLWPNAIDSHLISNENNQRQKALGLIQSIDQTLNNKKILDFGCGSTEVCNILREYYDADSFGYDIQNYNWKEFYYTTNLNIIKSNGPYDLILLFDVLDHTENPTETLKICKELLSENGVIFCRVHPWFSRSGTHLYKDLNKAYLQLIFNEKELQTLGIIQNFFYKIKKIEDYKKWFSDCFFDVLSEKKITQNIELFFTHDPIILRRIKENFENDFPREMLEIQIIDYILIKKN